MNATPSLGLPTMDDPFTDSMEMASPYNGHMDDFEIDIDIMDDQPANDDNDFDLQDASPGNVSEEHAQDADMMEDAPELNVVDTSAYNQDGGIQYTNNTVLINNNSVESEMVDEEYDEDIAPSGLEMSTGRVVEADTEKTETVDLIEPQISETVKNEQQDHQHVDQHFEAVQKREEEEEEQPSSQKIVEAPVDQDSVPEKPEETQKDFPQSAPTSLIPQDTNDHGDLQKQNKPDEETGPAIHEEVDQRETTEHETQYAGHDGSSVPSAENEALRGENGELHDAADQKTSYMHSIKVIYQESEISMFPPRHGDTSETYFLANEGLAHENLDRLFQECRAILGDHASTEDSLVFHIDCLGIELCEDNVHSCKITLSQILDTYLHLCRNSAIEQPEPLYLTLTTRATLPAELALLANAAKEGKGISDIQSWGEDYAQEETEEAEVSPDDLANQNADGTQVPEGIHEKQEIQDQGPVGDAESGQDVHQDIGHQAHVDSEETNDGEEEIHAPSNQLQEADDETENDETGSEGHAPLPNDTDALEPHLPTNDAETTDLKNSDSFRLTTGSGPHQQIEGTEVQDFAAQIQNGADEVLSSNVEEGGSFEGRDPLETANQGLESNDISGRAEHDTPMDRVEASQEEKEEGEEGEEEEEEEEEEGEYVEDEGQENYEDYTEAGYDETDLYDETHEDTQEERDTVDSGAPPNAGDGFPDASNAADTLDRVDEASSETVSAVNEPLDQTDHSLDNLQYDTKTEQIEDYDHHRDIPEYPDLPDDELFSLDDDIFADTAKPSHRDGDDENGRNESDHPNAAPAQVNEARDEMQGVPLKRQESTIGKRSREDEDDELDSDALSSPGTKRTRSS